MSFELVGGRQVKKEGEWRGGMREREREREYSGVSRLIIRFHSMTPFPSWFSQWEEFCVHMVNSDGDVGVLHNLPPSWFPWGCCSSPVCGVGVHRGSPCSWLVRLPWTTTGSSVSSVPEQLPQRHLQSPPPTPGSTMPAKPTFHTWVHHACLVTELAWFLEGKTVVLHGRF